MTTQLIPVFDGSISNEKTLLCDARELHLFLGVRKDFSSWIRERIADYGFIENEDFILLTHFGEQRKGRGGHNRKDYHLTIHTAKELAMVERNDKGRQIRRYFIECERQIKQQAPSPTFPGDYAVITYFENGLPVACHPLMPGEVVMNPDSCLEHVMRCGFVVIPANEVGQMTIDELNLMVSRVKQVRSH